MKFGKMTLASVIACALAVSSVPANSTDEDVEVAQASIGTPFDELNWIDEPWGGSTAVVWGDPKVGPFGILIDHPAGFSSPPGMSLAHSANVRAVILTGWMKVWREGQSAEDAPELPAGSYFRKVGGVYYHEAHSPDEHTLVYVVYDGPRDTLINGVSMPVG